MRDGEDVGEESSRQKSFSVNAKLDIKIRSIHRQPKVEVNLQNYFLAGETISAPECTNMVAYKKESLEAE